MTVREKFSCCIIGEGKLTIACAQQLIDQGHIVRGVVSVNEDVRQWAIEREIACTGTLQDQDAFLGQWEFDYLFSIINPRRVSSAALQLPRRSAINFHDAPLPRYAGLHVTTWAIANQESSFGVTWHEMTDDFDAGQILKQVSFPVDPEETAFSLNVKCFQHGQALFSELIDELTEGRETRRPQDLALRSSYLSSKRPDSAAIIDWSARGDAIEAMLRALSYQPDPNPIGMPKVVMAGTVYLVAEGELKAESGTVAPELVPGTVLSLSNKSIDIATATGVLSLTSLLSVDGEPIAIEQLVSSAALREGSVLPILSAPDRETIHQLDHRFGRHEKYWQGKLARLDPFIPSFQADHPGIGTGTGVAVISGVLSEDLSGLLEKTFPACELSDLLAWLYCCFLARTGDLSTFDIGINYAGVSSASAPSENVLTECLPFERLFAPRVPFTVSIDPAKTIKHIVDELSLSFLDVKQKGTYSRDLLARTPGLSKPVLPVVIDIVDDLGRDGCLGDGEMLTLRLQKNSGQFQWCYAAQMLVAGAAEKFSHSFKIFLHHVAADINASLANVPLIDHEEKQKLLVDWNQTQKQYNQQQCIHHLFEEQAILRANDVALAYRNIELTYAELNQRAENLALLLQRLGVRPDTRIGLFIDRSIDMVVGLMGILKAGAAYVPLDPAYPRDRVALMISDANLPILLTHSKLEQELPSNTAEIVCIDTASMAEASDSPATSKQTNVAAHNLAYVIYTSGSTGKPKGVMVEHRNAMNFFAGMDDVLDFQGEPGVWLAVTSISFDISVLEIFWSLTRGFKVVIQEEDARTLSYQSVSAVPRQMDVGLFYFSSDAGPSDNSNRYKLLMEGAKYADVNGFSTVWTPERHFHLFGGLYPNPSVTSAAIAAVTSNVAIRAGSIVLPLHNPIRVVEEWSVVDNLSGGRVGFSFASGWHANDFSILPENFENRKQVMYDNIETVRALWRGESITLHNGEGKPFAANVYPAPVQDEPPMWITTAGNIDSFRQAGEGGFNVLTNLLGQSIDDIKEKIAAYREGRKKNGHQGEGNVSVMVHTFVGADVEEVREIVREPFCNYLKTSFDLVKIAPWAFPAFRQPSKSAAQDPSFDAGSLTDEDMDALLEHAFDRYFETAGIFGTATSCLPLIDQLKSAGVDEIACLIDFGVDDDLVLDNLKHLNTLRQISNPSADSGAVKDQDFSIAAQIKKHKVTHFQCTPSMARILSADQETLSALNPLQKVLLGGEALPVDLANTIKQSISGELINMYGPTETTIWSTSSSISGDASDVTIGRPIANTQIYVLDSRLQPVATGIAGELFIGGDGVVRGYLDRPDLTAERFINNRFVSDAEAKIYRTGDLVRYRDNGDIEYLGRLDHQVKLRGYRLELGEIESIICANHAVKECVVVVPESDQGAESLVAYVVPGEAGKASLVLNDASSNKPTDHWQAIWDETYQTGTHSKQGQVSDDGFDPALNISGWLNSYTGEQHPEQHMREWVEATAHRILSLKPRRVLEIGCGTGMVLYRVAPHCETYVGVDFSESALGLIQEQLSVRGWHNVQLLNSEADALTQVLAETEPFDIVIINSVVQYFPSAEYLFNVLRQLSTLMAEQAQLFIGDVRSLAHMEVFHHSLELAKAPSNLLLPDLAERVKEHGQNESELVISPDFFFALTTEIESFSAVNVQLKRGRHHNEMSAFRYDVCISVGGEANDCYLTPADFNVLALPTSLNGLKEYLDKQSGNFVVRDIVNPRLEPHCYAHQLMSLSKAQMNIADIRSEVAHREVVGFDPEDVYQLSSSWRIELSWARSGKLDCYDAYFIDQKSIPQKGVSQENSASLNLFSLTEVKSFSDYCFEPEQHSDDYALTEQLRTTLRDKLPEFMVPSEFVILDALPLTPNGKIDRKALPAPEKRRRDVQEAFVAPENDIEKAIASVLQEMLNIEKIGTRDNFSDMGANSLLIVQANNRLSQKLERKVPLVSMYRYPTIASLAEHLSGNSDSTQGMEKGQKRGEKRRAAQASRKRRMASRKK